LLGHGRIFVFWNVFIFKPKFISVAVKFQQFTCDLNSGTVYNTFVGVHFVAVSLELHDFLHCFHKYIFYEMYGLPYYTV
jgi:hypothetical protein